MSINLIVLINIITTLTFLAISILIVYRARGQSQERLIQKSIIAAVFLFLFAISLSNVLEWQGISSALDPAEGFLYSLAILAIVYTFKFKILEE